MGNASTKEARPQNFPPSRHHGGPRDGHPRSSTYAHPSGSSRHNRGSRPDLSFLGISTNERDGQPEARRETRQEREARKREKERVARLKERERSMKEEHVDGGYLVTQGVYVGPEDFSKNMVRQLMIERKLAPFWKGLNEFSESWVEHQIMAAVRGMPIPPPDEIPPELEYKLTPKSKAEASSPDKNINNLTVPISSRSQSYTSDSSRQASPPGRSSAAPSPSPSNLFRGRAKTLASLTTSSKNAASPDMSPREFKLPHDPFVNGQPIETYLYKSGSECPICFLYYPPYLNQTRCCDQPICSECFVQIKRPDPHPPDHELGDTNAPGPSNEAGEQQEEQLISEPSACPFCVLPEFGVTYSPPPFRRGLTYATNHDSSHPLVSASSDGSSSSSLPAGARRRATSLSTDAPGVITTDNIRPDWAQKLAAARAHASRRSAAATALHTAAYLMNGGSGNSNEQRGTGNGGNSSRRGPILWRATNPETDSPGGRSNSPNVANLANLAERRVISDRENDSGNETSNLAPPRASSRRHRLDELEDMMMMEAIRLSLAAEEDQRKKEEKEAKKEAKKREKEAKKAEKRGRKAGLYSGNTSSGSLDAEASGSRNRANTAPTPAAGDHNYNPRDKGKGVDRSPQHISTQQDPASQPESSTAASPVDAKEGEEEQSNPPSHTAELAKRRHLRQLSSASSSNSSLVESAIGEQIGSNPPNNGSNSSLEPLFNFQSLAEVIGDEDKARGASDHVEDSNQSTSQGQGDTVAESQDEKQAAAGSSDQSPVIPSQDGPSQSQGVVDSKEVKTPSAELLSDAKPMEATQ